MLGKIWTCVRKVAIDRPSVTMDVGACQYLLLVTVHIAKISYNLTSLAKMKDVGLSLIILVSWKRSC